MFYQIFLSPQVKRWAIGTYKHDIYDLPHKLRYFTRKPELTPNIPQPTADATENPDNEKEMPAASKKKLTSEYSVPPRTGSRHTTHNSMRAGTSDFRHPGKILRLELQLW